MGQPDLYPFVLGPVVIGKLAFVHERVQRAGGRDPGPSADEDALRAMAASLRSQVAQPPVE
jgi:hypothetical protein